MNRAAWPWLLLGLFGLFAFALAAAEAAPLRTGFEAVAKIYDTRITSNPRAAALSAAFRQALGNYQDDRAPQGDPQIVGTFIDNLAQRLRGMQPAELVSLGNNAEQNNARYARGNRNNNLFTDSVDAVAFFTTGSDAVIGTREPDGKLTLRWPRGQNPRLATAATDWSTADDDFRRYNKANDQDFAARKRGLDLGQGGELDPDARTAGQTAHFAKRLQRFYFHPRLEMPDDLAADFGRLQYLMIGTDMVAGESRIAGLSRLHALNGRLAQTDFTDAAFRTMDPAQRSARSDALSQELGNVLAQREAVFGFLRGEVLPTDTLSASDFLAIVEAGYVFDDVGAAKEHGSMTHRIQLFALMEDFQNNPEAWNRTPLEVYSAIGRFDSERGDINARTRFGFERSPSLWAHLLDEQGGQEELSRPDSIETLFDGDPRLAEIRARTTAMRIDRIAHGSDLFDDFSAAVKRAASDPSFDILRDTPFGQFMDAAKLARMTSDLTSRDRTFVADQLFLSENFAGRIRRDGLVPASIASREIGVLMKPGEQLQRGVDRDEVKRQRRNWSDLGRDAEAAPEQKARDAWADAADDGDAPAKVSDKRKVRRKKPKREALNRDEEAQAGAAGIGESLTAEPLPGTAARRADAAAEADPDAGAGPDDEKRRREDVPELQ